MENPVVKASVILSKFDQPRALSYALIGYQRQSTTDFEIVIADDGSDTETRAVVHEFEKHGTIRIKHVWQENKGYRRSKIANEAVKISSGSTIILSDGDCIPHQDFVRHHLSRGGPNTFCVGGYVRLNDEQTMALTPELVRNGAFEPHATVKDFSRFRWMHWKNMLYIAFRHPRKPKVYGCNISVHRDLYYAVNGYNENFDGFGKEDSDLRNRLVAFGARPVSLWGRATVFHLTDKLDPKITQRRIPRKKNREYYDRPNVPSRCVNGLVKEGVPSL